MRRGSCTDECVTRLGRLALLFSALMAAACGREAGPRPEGPLPRPLAVVEAVPLEGLARETLTLPNLEHSVKFAVIGDSGRGNQAQQRVADQMVRYHTRFTFPFTLMVGDNIYEGPAGREDYRLKFEEPYRALLDEGVKFFAALGNHDDPREIHCEHFNMRGRRYYRFAPPGNLLARITTPVAFFALDSKLHQKAVFCNGNARLPRGDVHDNLFIHVGVPPAGSFKKMLGNGPVSASASFCDFTASMRCLLLQLNLKRKPCYFCEFFE